MNSVHFPLVVSDLVLVLDPHRIYCPQCKRGISFILLHINIPFSQCRILKMLSFLQCLSKVRWLKLYDLVSVSWFIYWLMPVFVPAPCYFLSLWLCSITWNKDVDTFISIVFAQGYLVSLGLMILKIKIIFCVFEEFHGVWWDCIESVDDFR